MVVFGWTWDTATLGALAPKWPAVVLVAGVLAIVLVFSLADGKRS